ncbi:MAG: sialate O-acetylesterase [Candidatus Fimimonas sp.]
MKQTLSAFLLLLLIFSLCACNVDTTDYSLEMNVNYPLNDVLAEGNGETARVILLLGQSNASGCSIVEYLQLNVDEQTFDYYEKGFDNVLINYCIDDHSFTSNGAFVRVDLTSGCGNGFFGPEVGMAETLSKQFPNEKFYILKYTMSGYSLANHWLRNGKRSDIYNACLAFVHAYLQYLQGKNYNVSLDAICWMQGESDTAMHNAEKYFYNQRKFVKYLRRDLRRYKAKGIYFIDAGISSSPYCEPGYPLVNQAKQRISEMSAYNLYFSTIDLGLTTLYEPDYDPDLGHYDSLSEIKLGNLFGEYVASIYRN